MTTIVLSLVEPSMSDAHLSAFSDWLTSWGAAESTIRSRTTILAAQLRAWGDPATVTTHDLEAWLATPAFSQWTRVAYYGHARSYFGWLVDVGHLEVDPTVRLRRPRTPRGAPRPLRPDELERVMGAATGNTRTWLLLALYAGLRAHEIAKLRGEDVGPDVLHVVGKGGQAAMIPTHPEVWALARVHARHGWWFPSPRDSTQHVASTSVSTAATRLFSSVGVPGSLHRARHSFGTNLLRGGANIRVVQSLMRHSSLATTALYTAVDDDERAAAIRGLAA